MKLYEEDIKILECIQRSVFAHGSGSYIEGISKESMDFVLSRVIDDLKGAQKYSESMKGANNE